MKTVFAKAAVCALVISSFPLLAQEAAAPLTVQLRTAQPEASLVLPANTEVPLRVTQEITTKGRSWSEGDNFDLSVAGDVVVDNYVVIPRGSRAVGHITYLTDKGMFGKSGKLEIELDYIMIGERRIPINGSFRQEGEGNTVATVAGVLAAGPFAAVITGRSGLIPAGRELIAYTENDIPLAVETAVAAREQAVIVD